MSRVRSGGFTLVEIMIVLAIIAIVATLAIINLLHSDRAANETAAIKALQSLATAQVEHRRSENTYADLAALVDPNGKHRVPKLQDGTDHGYAFQEIEAATVASYSFAAFPLEDAQTGIYTYIVNDEGTIWKKDTDSVPPGAWPADPAADGWTEAK